MKVNPTTAYHAYKNVAEYTSHTSRQPELHEERAAKAEQMDQIQISAEGVRKMEISQISRTIVGQIQEPASPARLEKLEQLKTAVQNKTYHVATGDLVDAMMRHVFMA